MFRTKTVSTSRRQDGEAQLDKDHISKMSTRRIRTQCRSFAVVLAALLMVGISGWCFLLTKGVGPLVAYTQHEALTTLDRNASHVAAVTSLRIGDQDKTSQPEDQKRFAYFFYVTTDTYACAAIQFIHRLTNDLQMNSSRIDIVVLHTRRIGDRLLRKLHDRYHVRTILVDPVKADAAEPTWKESLTKLRTFQDWGYDRVVFLDADAVPMANLDHLFDLPSAPLYAPTAYWLEQPFFASTLLVIEPSGDVFNDIIRWARERGAAAGFDMDILNKYFADSVQYLPGVYTVLNSDFRRAPNEKTTLFNTTSELKEHVQVVHFSCKPDGSYGKPWKWPSRDLSLLDGEQFDPLFRQLFVDYWRREQELCSS